MCSVDLGDDYCEVWSDTWVKAARKQYTCDSCGGNILAGEGYEKHFNIFQGKPESQKTCGPCVEVRKEFKAEHGAIRPPSSTMELLEECIESRDDFRSMLKWARRLRALAKRGKAARAPETRT